MFDWFAANPTFKDIRPQWNNATQTLYNGKQVVEVPVTSISALFFTKVNGVLNVDVYKWNDKKPGDKVFSGNVTVISLQDFTLSAYRYVNGQLQNSGFISLLNSAQSHQSPSDSLNRVQSPGTLININNGSKTLRISFAPKQLTLSNFFIDLGCWISGGRVLYGQVDGCDWGHGSIYSDIGDFLAGMFSGGGDGGGSLFGTYGSGSVGYLSSDGSSVTFTAGGGGMAYLTINNPCNTAPPPWFNAGGSSALSVSASRILRVQDSGDPCGGNYSNTQWVPFVIPPVANVTPQDIISSLLVTDDKFLLNCDSLALLKIAAYQNYGNMYQQVAQFVPSQAVRDRIDSLNSLVVPGDLTSFGIQNLSNASGSVVNSDFFPVKISSLPTGATMASLTEYFRIHMTDFTSGKATFSPYVDSYLNDTQKFNQTGANSVGALVHIRMFNDGTIVESGYQSGVNGTSYKYTTMSSPLDYNHPVSGNREFGVYADPNSPGTYTFYTMGVDRISDWQFAFGNWLAGNVAFNDADQLWSAMQSNMINYINNNGGQAGYYNKKSYVARPNWNVVQAYLNGTITLQQLKQTIGC